jgi:ABC-2 type transport system ATP-binding protein
MSIPAIRIQGLTKHRGAKAVFSNLDLIVSEGEFLGLAGVNGAGKTTLIKCLLDLDTPTSGKISIFNNRHNQVSAREPLAYLPENFRPPGHINGREFLNCICRLHGSTPDLLRMDEMLEILDMEPGALEQRSARLSKGNAQKLGLAACLMSGKRLLVLDEPMDGLDPRARACLHDHLLKLKRHNLTCFFTTHLLADVEKICDRIAVLHQGKIRYTGSPAACRRRYDAMDLEQAFLRCSAGGRRYSGPE